MSVITVFFLVVILSGGDQDILNRVPVEYPDQQTCMNEGVALMIDKRQPLDVYCIEADDENDLVKIMNAAFNFGGESS